MLTIFNFTTYFFIYKNYENALIFYSKNCENNAISLFIVKRYYVMFYYKN